MVTDFVALFKNSITGNFDSKTSDVSLIQSKQDLTGGAKIKMHFYSLYKDLANYNASSRYSDKDIERAILLHEGDDIPGFPKVDVFKFLVQPCLDKLKDPA